MTSIHLQTTVHRPAGEPPAAKAPAARPGGVWVFLLAAALSLLVVSCRQLGKGREGTLAAGTRIAFVEGKVSVSGKPAAVGQKLESGQVLEVEPGARAELDLGHDARAVVEASGDAPARLEVGAEKGQAGRMLMKLLEGIGRFILPHPGRTHLEVQGRRSLTAARGTEFLVETTEEKDRIAVRLDSVEVKNLSKGDSAILQKGEQLEISADGKLGKPEPFDYMAPEERDKWQQRAPTKVHGNDG